jgi:16S rRNA (cytosine1402-N4)-methyltransferase
MTKQIAEMHTPVMLERCLEWLRPALVGERPTVIDATLGMGGHSEALLEHLPNLRVYGIDRDPEAILLATRRLARFGARFTAVQTTYDEIEKLVSDFGLDAVDGVLMDLGVSSMQLDEAERGFAYAQDAPLDMRMNQTAGVTAADLLNTLSSEKLVRIFREYGEERFAPRIAEAIVSFRATKPITRSTELNQLVTDVVPQHPGKSTGHPAKRIYQALRIAVNEELAVLENALPQAIQALRVGGRLVVMSYHSLEDGITKRAMQAGAASKTPTDLPFVLPGTSPELKILTKGVERASEREIASNPRAASARLRVAEKLERV